MTPSELNTHTNRLIGWTDFLILSSGTALRDAKDEEIVKAPGRWVDWDQNSCELEDIMLNAELMDWYIL